MTRIILLVVLMVAVLATTVNAQTMVGKFLGIEWEADSEIQEKRKLEQEGICYNEFVLQQETQWWNNDELFQQTMELFDEGYYVLHLTGEPYMGSKYYTAFLTDNKQIKWIKKGFCVNHNEYNKYSTDIDISATQQKYTEQYKEGEFNAIKSGYNVIQRIDGLGVYEKFRIVSMATKYLATHSIYPDRGQQ